MPGRPVRVAGRVRRRTGAQGRKRVRNVRFPTFHHVSRTWQGPGNGGHSAAMMGVRGLLTILCVLAAAPAVAGTVYRCDSADGGRSYSSKKVAGAKCTAVSSYTASKKYKAPAPAAWMSTPSPAPAAVGSVTPANAVEGSPASASLPAQAKAAGHPRAAVLPDSAPGARTGLLLHQGRRAPLHQQGAEGRVRRECGPHHQVQLPRDLLRLQRPARRQFRHAAPQHRRLPGRDQRRGAPARRRRGDRARHHPCRIVVQSRMRCRASARRA